MDTSRLATILTCAFVFTASAVAKPAQVSSIKPNDLVEFDSQPAEIQSLIRYALNLTQKKLRYSFGSCDPKNGGMDCSGTVYHILRAHGIDSVPRQSNHQYLWVKEHGNLKKMKAHRGEEASVTRHLKPGDLLFWEGTYNTGKRNPPTSHVQIFLGHLKSNGKPVMVGASSGRYYSGRARHGVSVFDFQLPRKSSRSKFVAYGAIPGLENRVARSGPSLGIPNMAGAILERLRDLDGDGK